MKKKKKSGESDFCRGEGDASTSRGVGGGDEGEGGTINSLTPLNVHLMMHT